MALQELLRASLSQQRPRLLSGGSDAVRHRPLHQAHGPRAEHYPVNAVHEHGADGPWRSDGLVDWGRGADHGVHGPRRLVCIRRHADTGVRDDFCHVYRRPCRRGKAAPEAAGVLHVLLVRVAGPHPDVCVALLRAGRQRARLGLQELGHYSAGSTPVGRVLVQLFPPGYYEVCPLLA